MHVLSRLHDRDVRNVPELRRRAGAPSAAGSLHVVTRAALLEELAAEIDALRPGHPVRVGIDGVDASGKTTLANDLAAVLKKRGRSTLRASVDDFHLPAAHRYRRGALSGEGYYRDSFDYERLEQLLLGPLGPGGSLLCRRVCFDHRTDSEVDAPLEEVPPDAVLVFDGIFLHREALCAHWDYSIFVRVDFETTVARAEERDRPLLGSVEEIRRRYAKRYVPGQRIYLDEAEPERRASVVVDNADPTRPLRVSPA